MMRSSFVDLFLLLDPFQLDNTKKNRKIMQGQSVGWISLSIQL